MFTSAMSLNVDVSSEFRNADATTSSLGAPILGVQSESPVSGTTSSCVCGGEYWVSIGCHYLGGIWVFEYVLDTNCSPARLRKTASAPSPCTAAPVAFRGRRYRAAATTPVNKTQATSFYLIARTNIQNKLTSAVPSPVIHQGHPAPTEHTGIVNSHSINERDMCRV